jgi:hypothetical protein
MYSVRILAFILLGAAIGVAVGWTLAPRLRTGSGDPEQQLRARAAEYYAASRRLDKWTMVRAFTPARQLEETDVLRRDADATSKAAAKLSADNRRDAELTAAGIKPEALDVQLEGDWAVTRGNYSLIVGDKKIEQLLDPLVWVRHGGQWWVYDFKLYERNTYGHPPDFALELDPLR